MLQKETAAQNFRIKKLVSWMAVIAWCGLIFAFSAQTGDESSAVSGGLCSWISKGIAQLLGQEPAGAFPRGLEVVIRKLAHGGVYFVLGLLAANLLRLYRTRPSRAQWLVSLLAGLLYAVSDEVHQLFVSGRAGRVTDVLIDFIGYAVGFAILLWMRRVLARRADRRQGLIDC